MPLRNRQVSIEERLKQILTGRPNLDKTQCECVSSSFYYGVNQGGGSVLCVPCPGNYVRI
jgi:hypothetical protein